MEEIFGNTENDGRKLPYTYLTGRQLLRESLKQNWPIRLQDKNNEFQPKLIEPIMSRRKTSQS